MPDQTGVVRRMFEHSNLNSLFLTRLNPYKGEISQAIFPVDKRVQFSNNVPSIGQFSHLCHASTF